MATNQLIQLVAENFGRIYLGGILCLLNEDGAFLSFINSLTAIEALGGLPQAKGGQRATLQGIRSGVLS